LDDFSISSPQSDSQILQKVNCVSVVCFMS
jgi:hypothetical protein